MLQRGITEKEIKSLMENPDIIRESYKERVAVRKGFSKGALEVIYKKSEDRLTVITCYWIKGG